MAAGRRHGLALILAAREIVGMLVLSVALFALAFVAQGELTAGIG